jgi:hypothetical protein
MKSLIQAVAIAAAISLPLAAIAQTVQPKTRAEVRQELVQAEQAGFNPTHVDPQNPLAYQAAQARIEQNTAMGGAAYGTSEQGQAAK